MQFPRYELSIPREHPPPARSSRPPRAWRQRRGRVVPRAILPRRRPRPLLAPHQYLELEFAVEE
jgi:hypothetical protein